MPIYRLHILLLLALTLLSACLPPAASPAPTASPPAPTTNPAPLPVVVPVEYNEVIQKPGLTITARFPRITLPGDQRYDQFNQSAEALVRGETDAFKAEITDPKNRFAELQMGSFIDVTYDVFYGERGLVSVLFYVTYYLSGAAHPNHRTMPLNFDLTQNKPLNLADIFQKDTPYLQALVDLCTADLKRRNAMEWSENLKPVPETFHSWVIQKDSLLIWFDPYEVASYAAGPQKVLLPYTALKGYINPAGPLQALIQ
jgi:hypothetical protein